MINIITLILKHLKTYPKSIYKWICEYDNYIEDEDNEEEEQEKEKVIDYKALFEKLQQENDELQNKNKKLKRKLKKLSEKEEKKKEEANTEIDSRNAIFGFDKIKEDEPTHNPFNCVRKKK